MLDLDRKQRIEKRKKMERAIVECVAKHALADGYTITINNGGDQDLGPFTELQDCMNNIMQSDQDVFHLNGNYGEILFVYGNDGFDVLADHSGKLSDCTMILEAEKLADSLQDE